MGLEKRWILNPVIDNPTDKELDIYHPILRQLLFNRGVYTRNEAAGYLNSAGSLYDPNELKSMDTAIARLRRAIKDGELIVIYGDYDVDGVTACTLLVEVLQKLDAQVERYVPNRFEEGYGLSIDGLDNLIETYGKPDLIITVDCGIRSPKEVDEAKRRGIDIIVTDHHEPGEILPSAIAVICPKQPGDDYPEKNLAGVGVAFKLCEAYLSRYADGTVDITQWLDLVALGTVADIVPLTGENRSMVKAGLRLMRYGQRPGLVSLANAAGIDIRQIKTSEISFGLAPRLNAAGRLETAMLALDLLLSGKIEDAAPNAQRLDDQNRQRQAITRSMLEEAAATIEPASNDFVLIATNRTFNMGVVGLVASKLVDAYYRPAIVGAEADGYIRASCRSIPEFHITKALDECSDLFEKHGGHAMAAGFTIKTEKLPILKQRMNTIAQTILEGRDLQPELRVDMEINLSTANPKDIFASIDEIEPVGSENPDVRFLTRKLQVVDKRQISDGKHLKMRVKSGLHVFDAIAFGLGERYKHLPEHVDLVYNYELNSYRGQTNIQLNVRDIKATEMDELILG
ncbi:MAG: single-stranded-DNA-specific exonuclease RecJ [Anaerolineae bacterium]|nr:single-stranded-DNA-specific exonuclease RecJ [Anaerolineae bacterium]